MISYTTLGHTLVLGGLGMAAAGSVAGFVAGAKHSLGGLRWARALSVGFALCMIVANVVMIAALIQHDFSVSYVAEVGTVHTPLHITIVSLWASLSGSILLWAGVLGIYVLGLVIAMGERYRLYQGYTLGVLLAVCVMFGLLVAGVANPFAPTPLAELEQMARIYGAGPDGMPVDGPGPNPLLQNHWLMILHPPTLYLGYVGMSLTFAMCAAALLAGRLDAGWMVPLRRAFLIPWAFLTLGIVLGGWWSYAVLGWGGYWAWDPVENASFLPWLTGTAFLHSAMMTHRRTSLKSWTLLLGMGTFLLTLFGTFLTRSGVFNSVHAFGTGSVGPVLLTFIVICGVFTVVLLALREHRLHEGARELPGGRARVPRQDQKLSPQVLTLSHLGLWSLLVGPPAVAITWALWRALPLEIAGVTVPVWASLLWLPLLGLLWSRRLLSRDVMIVAQNAVFTLFTFVVFLGTTFPILAESLRDKKVSVGEPFYDAFAFPLGVLIVWLMGVGPMLPWGQQSIVGAWKRFLGPVSFGAIATLLVALTGVTKPYTLIAIFVCAVALAANLGELLSPLYKRIVRSKAQPLPATWDLLRKGRRRWGGHLAHYGIILCVVCVALSKGYAVEQDLMLAKGERVTFEDYELAFLDAKELREPHRTRTVARFEVFREGRSVGIFEPSLNMYRTRSEGLTSPAVRSTPTHDLYLSLMSVQPGGTHASLHLKRMPFVVWIWLSPLPILLGTLLAAFPEIRLRRRTVDVPASGEVAA
ncbi:MAG: heme lyase CcmF/NrfE family subunit [Deltaproteobacteria bacterium]|nr:MAG: heme lyase CcmF/NrfE family subunit [Deltaproteobacteria bacterium]